MINRSEKFRIIFILILVGCIAGCYSKFGSLEPNSHFAYPNSNVKAIGPVQASDWKLGFIFGRSIDKPFVMKVYNEALRTSGGDLIIDAKFDTSTLMLWPFSVTTLTLDGTAATMVIGKQELK